MTLSIEELLAGGALTHEITIPRQWSSTAASVDGA